MLIESRQKNDCTIVALTHYFGLDYNDVREELLALSIKLGIVWNMHKVTPNILAQAFCYKRGLKSTLVPRRGQDKITGIVSMHATGTKKGHMVAMIDGIVFDALQPEGMPIKDYQLRYKHSHIRSIWK